MDSKPVTKHYFRQHLRNTSILGSLYSFNQQYYIYNNNIKVNLATIRNATNWQNLAENILTKIVNDFYNTKNIYHKSKIITYNDYSKQIYPQLLIRLNYEIVESLWINSLLSRIQKQFLKKNKKNLKSNGILCNMYFT